MKNNFLYLPILLICSLTMCKKQETSLLTITPTTKDANEAAGSFEVVISSNISWTASSNADWIILEVMTGVGNSTITIDFQANTLTTTRTGKITFKGADVEDKILTITQIGVAPILTQGLVAYYPFNGNANDETGNSHNGTVNDATLTTDKNGNTNSAYSFDGVNDYINISNIDLANKSFSISFWLKRNNYGNRIAIGQGIV
jgi:hypothetical protein